MNVAPSRVCPVEDPEEAAEGNRTVQVISLDSERAILHVAQHAREGWGGLYQVEQSQGAVGGLVGELLRLAAQTLPGRADGGPLKRHGYCGAHSSGGGSDTGRLEAVDVARAVLNKKGSERFISVDVVASLSCGCCCLLANMSLPLPPLSARLSETVATVSVAEALAVPPRVLSVCSPPSSPAAAGPVSRQPGVLSACVCEREGMQRRPRSVPLRGDTADQRMLIAFTQDPTTVCMLELCPANAKPPFRWEVKHAERLPVCTHTDGTLRSPGVTRCIRQVRWCPEGERDFTDNARPFLAVLHATSPLPGTAAPPMEELSLMMVDTTANSPVTAARRAVGTSGGGGALVEGPWGVRSLDLAYPSAFVFTPVLPSPLPVPSSICIGILARHDDEKGPGTVLMVFNQHGEVGRSTVLRGHVLSAIVVCPAPTGLVLLLSSQVNDTVSERLLLHLTVALSPTASPPATRCVVTVESRCSIEEEEEEEGPVPMPKMDSPCSTGVSRRAACLSLMTAYLVDPPLHGSGGGRRQLHIVGFAVPTVVEHQAATDTHSSCAERRGKGYVFTTAMPVPAGGGSASLSSLTPVPWVSSVAITAVAASGSRCVVLLRDGRLFSWDGVAVGTAHPITHLKAETPSTMKDVQRRLLCLGSPANTRAVVMPVASASLSHLTDGPSKLLVVTSREAERCLLLVAVLGGRHSGTVVHTALLQADSLAPMPPPPSLWWEWWLCPVAALPGASRSREAVCVCTLLLGCLVLEEEVRDSTTTTISSSRGVSSYCYLSLVEVTVTQYVPCVSLAGDAGYSAGADSPAPRPREQHQPLCDTPPLPPPFGLSRIVGRVLQRGLDASLTPALLAPRGPSLTADTVVVTTPPPTAVGVPVRLSAVQGGAAVIVANIHITTEEEGQEPHFSLEAG